MAYVAPGTVASGSVWTAAQVNVLVNDIIDHEARINNQPPLASARVGLTADLAYTSNADIVWNSSASVQSGYNVGSMWSSGTNPARLTIQTAGIYLVVFNYAVTFTGTATQFSPYIYANGSTILADNTQTVSQTSPLRGCVTTIKSFAAAEYVTARISFTGLTLPIIQAATSGTQQCGFSIAWIGRTS